jgi:hypothetical protein
MGGVMTPLNKRDHQWLAVGNADLLKDVNDVETLQSWYKDAVMLDPTCFQFFEAREWTLGPCMVDETLKMKPVATLQRLRAPNDPCQGFCIRFCEGTINVQQVGKFVERADRHSCIFDSDVPALPKTRDRRVGDTVLPNENGNATSQSSPEARQ